MSVFPDIWISTNVNASYPTVTLVVLEKQLIEVATLVRQSIQLAKILGIDWTYISCHSSQMLRFVSTSDTLINLGASETTCYHDRCAPRLTKLLQTIQAQELHAVELFMVWLVRKIMTRSVITASHFFEGKMLTKIHLLLVVCRIIYHTCVLNFGYIEFCSYVTMFYCFLICPRIKCQTSVFVCFMS